MLNETKKKFVRLCAKKKNNKITPVNHHIDSVPGSEIVMKYPWTVYLQSATDSNRIRSPTSK